MATFLPKYLKDLGQAPAMYGLIAGLFMYSMGAADSGLARSAVLGVPFVSEEMFVTTGRDFRRAGIWAMCLGPASGIPYKVYAIQASAHAGLVAFLLVSIPARLERFVLSWVLFAVPGRVFRKCIRRHPAGAAVVHAAYWAAVYAYYWAAL